MNLHTTSSELKNIKLNITNHFDKNEMSQWTNNTLVLNNDLVKGTIQIVSVSDHIFFTEFDIECSENIDFKVFSGDFSVVNFLYCLDGEINQKFSIENTTNKLNAYQSAIVKTEVVENLVVSFKAATKTTTAVISAFSNEDISHEDESIAAIFKLFNKNNEVHLDSYNLKIAEHLDSFNNIEGSGLIKALQIEATVMIILAKMIKEHKSNISNQVKFQTHLSIREINIVRDLCDTIVASPEAPYCINQLMLNTGLSAAKLQEGFKLVSGFTITEFIRNSRLEKAEELIKTTDLTISEVVYTIGFSSRSYFSKIFREKYKCSPKYYQEHAGNLVSISA